MENKRILGFSLWNNKYLFVGYDDSKIRIIKISTGIIVKTLNGHDNIVLIIK